MARGLYQDPLAQLVSGVLVFLLAAGLLLHNFVTSRESDAVGIKVMLYCLGVFYGSLSVGSVLCSLWRRSVALKDLPGPNYSLLGCIDVLRRPDPHRWLAEIVNKYGPIVKIRVTTFHAVIITDPALAVHILHSPLLDKFSFMYSFLDALLGGPSILTGPTDGHWRQVRKAVAPAFSTSHMRCILPNLGNLGAIGTPYKDATDLVVAKSEQLVAYLLKEGPTAPQNMDKLLLRESMDVIGRAGQFGFSKDLQALDTLGVPADEFENGLSDVDVLLGATKEIEDRLGGPQRQFQLWKKELWHGAYLLRRYRRQVTELLSHIKQKAQKRDSFADLLLHAKHHKTGKALSDKEMTPEVAALFFAGVDTTGHTGTWLLYLLTQHPVVEASIVAELDDLDLLVTADRPQPRKLTYGDLNKLVYLQAVVKEVLRMYPPVGIGQLREASTDVLIAEQLRIPKGCLVWIPHYAIQNAPFNWKSPDSFNPDRWLQPGAEFASVSDLPLELHWYNGLNLSTPEKPRNLSASIRQPKRYFPFAEGPRNCVGQSLAKVSLVATAATLLSQLSFKLADQMGGAEGVRRREEYKLVTGIRDGMWMHPIPRFVARDNN